MSAQYTESTDLVREMPLFKRDCLRHDEDMADYPDVKLSVFSNYSRKACLLECQATELFKKCECLLTCQGGEKFSNIFFKLTK